MTAATARALGLRPYVPDLRCPTASTTRLRRNVDDVDSSRSWRFPFWNEGVRRPRPKIAAGAADRVLWGEWAFRVD